jgi:hypothetical protein
MTGDDLDSFAGWRPYRVEDAIREDARMRRSMSLGMALWGRTAEDLQRQLNAPHPEIPSGFDLHDFGELQRRVEMVARSLSNPRILRLARSVASSATFAALTTWDARLEIVRRAVEYLEGR